MERRTTRPAVATEAKRDHPHGSGNSGSKSQTPDGSAGQGDRGGQLVRNPYKLTGEDMRYTKDDVAEALSMCLIYLILVVAMVVAAAVWR